MFKKFLSIGNVQIGVGILVFFTLVAVFGEWIVRAVFGYGPFDVDRNAIGQPPSAEHWLGTTTSGQDVLAWLVTGTRISMTVGVVSMLIGLGLSVLFGMLAGYAKGWWGQVINGFILLVGTIPSFPIIVILAAIFQNANIFIVAIVIGIFEWAPGARVIRGQTLSLRNRDFNTALTTIGESKARIVFAETFPHLFGVLTPYLMLLFAAGIGTQAALAFLGMGSAEDASWGLMMNYAMAQNALFIGAWWWFFPPGLCIAIIGFATVLINFGIDEVVNPQLDSKRLRLWRKYSRKVEHDPVTPEKRAQEVKVGT